MHHHKAGSAAGGDSWRCVGGGGGRGGDGLGETSLSAVLSSADFTSSSSSCSSSQDESSTPVLDDVPMTRRRGSPMYFRNGAGYYGYLYDRVFASHIWERLFKNDPWSKEAGEKVWQAMLRHGGGKDPHEMLREVLGEEPALDSFLAELDGEEK
eukprot:evm.model.NODE_4038_length_3987_cov_22.595436.2